MTIEDYKELIGSKDLLNVVFSAAKNQEEIFCAYDEDGVELQLPYKEYFRGSSSNKEENQKRAAGAIRSAKNVIVKSVDEENNIVTVSYLGALAVERKIAQNNIDKKLEAGEYVRTQGNVIDVRGSGKQSFAIIRFKNSNLKGILWCDRWSPAYIEDLKDKVFVGMEVEVDIIERNESKVEPRCRYICARDTVVGDVWKGIESRYHKDDIVNVKCESPWGRFFAGSITGEKELAVRMLVPQKKEGVEPLLIVPGFVYQCVVAAVHEENHTFRVRPIRICNAEPGVKRVVRIIT